MALPQASTSEQTIESLCFYSLFIILGVTPLFLNTIVLSIIFGLKSLKNNRWLVLTAALLISDTTLSVGYVIKSVITMEQLVRVDNRSVAVTRYTSTECVSWGIPLLMGSISDQLMTLFIAVDRAIAITKPKYYRMKAGRIVKLILIITVVVAVAFVVTSFIGIPRNDTIYFCTFTTGLLLNFKTGFYSFAHATSLSLVSVYIYLLVLTKIRIRMLEQQQNETDFNDVNRSELERQMVITKKISPLIIAYCFTSVPGFSGLDILPRIMLINANATTIVNMNRALMSSQLLVSINTCINAALYTWRNEEIWEKLRAMLIRFKNHIVVNKVGVNSNSNNIHISLSADQNIRV